MSYRDKVAKRLRTNEALEEEVLILRRMVCLSYSKHPYTDDGELQDNEWPMIDFKRDTIQEIRRKMSERTNEVIIEMYKEKSKLDEAKDLLNAANCPCCDKSGAYYDGHGEVCQCQWCDEVSKL